MPRGASYGETEMESLDWMNPIVTVCGDLMEVATRADDNEAALDAVALAQWNDAAEYGEWE